MPFDQANSKIFINALTVVILLNSCAANANKYIIANWIINVLIGKIIPKHVSPMLTDAKIICKRKENQNARCLGLLANLK
jgi:hypothetical protein